MLRHDFLQNAFTFVHKGLPTLASTNFAYFSMHFGMLLNLFILLLSTMEELEVGIMLSMEE